MKKQLLIISALWCPSCLLLNKHLKKIQAEYENIEIKKLDFDFDEEEVKPYHIGSILPVMILKTESGQEIGRLVGEKNEDEIMEFITKNIQN